MTLQKVFVLPIVMFYAGQTLNATLPAGAIRKSGALAVSVPEIVVSSTSSGVKTVGAGFASVDLGHISWQLQESQTGRLISTKDHNSFSVRSNVDLRLDCPPVDAGRRASIAALLPLLDSRYAVALDQVTLSNTAAIVDPLMTCGDTKTHTLSVDVPVSASAGPINANVSFQVTLQ